MMMMMMMMTVAMVLSDTPNSLTYPEIVINIIRTVQHFLLHLRLPP
jgi:hypothetical protein